MSVTSSGIPTPVAERIAAIRDKREDAAAVAAAELAMRREREAAAIRQAVRAELGPTWSDLPIEVDRDCRYASHIAIAVIHVDELPCVIETVVTMAIGDTGRWIVTSQWRVSLWHNGEPYRLRDVFCTFEDALLAAAEQAGGQP